MLKRIALTVVVLLVVASMAQASGPTLWGTVTGIEPGTLRVRTDRGDAVTVMVTPETRYKKWIMAKPLQQDPRATARFVVVGSRVGDGAIDTGLAGVFGGLVGAKLLWVAEHLGEEPIAQLLLSRRGMSWFGGFAGGVIAGLWLMHRRRLPVIAVLAAATPGLAVGHAIGRVGCFLVGDDYGRPSSLPWAVAFPNGLPPTTIPVHPMQLYEMAALLPIAFMLIRWRKKGRPDRFVLGAYLTLAGLVRFVIEFVRINDRVVGVLTVAHLASLAAVAIGTALLIMSSAVYKPRERPA